MSSLIPSVLRSAGAHNVCRYLAPSGPRVAVVNREEGRLWPLDDCARDPAAEFSLAAAAGDTIGVIRAWDTLEEAGDLALVGDGISLDDVRLLAPLRPARNVMCVGKNYVPHIGEVDSSLPGIAHPAQPAHPIIFTKAPECVVGPGGSIRLPDASFSTSIDYEGEVALVVGKDGSVFGVTCLNDVTARDIQKRHQQWFLGKSCDTFCPLGPWITLADAVDWRRGLQVITRVNGEERQRGDGSQLLFSPQVLLDSISAGTSLVPGDVIATGTPAGVGAGFDPPKFLSAGDVVEIEVEGVGILKNEVI